MGRFYEVDQAKRRLRDHLKGSINHDLSEKEAEEEVERFDFEQCREEETWDEEPAAAHSRSAASKSYANRPRSPQRRSRSRSPLRRGAQLTLTGPAHVQQGTVARLDDTQRDTIFKFAKAMGKCDAVIRTAARVCKQAAISLEVRVLFLLR